MASWNPKEQEEIEFRIKAISQFLELWVRYGELFEVAYHDQQAESSQEEEFLKIKGQLARRHQYLSEYLGNEYARGKKEPITPFLSDTVTMRNMTSIQFDFYKKLMLQWHHTYLNMNEALGELRVHLELEIPLEA